MNYETIKENYRTITVSTASKLRRYYKINKFNKNANHRSVQSSGLPPVFKELKI
jgi:hypothetical protein